MFAGFKEENIIAGMQIGERIQGCIVVIGGFGVEFGVFSCMRQKLVEVIEKMSVSASCVSGGR